MKNIFLTPAFLIFFFTHSILAQDASLNIPKGCKESEFLTSDSVRLHYLISGKGEALIFIPGWTMPAEIWEKQIEHFSKTNLVIAVDPRSQGKSAQTTEGLYLEREAKDLKELVDHLHLSSYYLVGWSWAGFVLYHYLKVYNSSSIKGIVIVDTPLKLDEALLKIFSLRIKVFLEDRIGAADKFIRRMYKQPQTESYLKKVFNASLITPTNSAVTMLTIVYTYNDSVWTETLKTFDKPVLFIGADGKEEVLKEINKELKLDYVIIPGSGHAVFVDKPVEFNTTLEKFISKN
jgi:non-heme chloroperoxidase